MEGDLTNSTNAIPTDDTVALTPTEEINDADKPTESSLSPEAEAMLNTPPDEIREGIEKLLRSTGMWDGDPPVTIDDETIHTRLNKLGRITLVSIDKSFEASTDSIFAELIRLCFANEVSSLVNFPPDYWESRKKKLLFIGMKYNSIPTNDENVKFLEAVDMMESGELKVKIFQDGLGWNEQEDGRLEFLTQYAEMVANARRRHIDPLIKLYEQGCSFLNSGSLRNNTMEQMGLEEEMEEFLLTTVLQASFTPEVMQKLLLGRLEDASKKAKATTGSAIVFYDPDDKNMDKGRMDAAVRDEISKYK